MTGKKFVSQMTLLFYLFIFSNCPQQQTGSEPSIWSKQFDNRSDWLAASTAGRRRNNQHLTGSRVILLPNSLREEQQCSRCVTKKNPPKTQKTWACWVALCNQLSCVLLFLLVTKIVTKKSVSSCRFIPTLDKKTDEWMDGVSSSVEMLEYNFWRLLIHWLIT